MADFALALVSIVSGLGAATALGLAMWHHLHLVAHDRGTDIGRSQ